MWLYNFSLTLSSSSLAFPGFPSIPRLWQPWPRNLPYWIYLVHIFTGCSAQKNRLNRDSPSSSLPARRLATQYSSRLSHIRLRTPFLGSGSGSNIRPRIKRLVWNALKNLSLSVATAYIRLNALFNKACWLLHRTFLDRLDQLKGNGRVERIYQTKNEFTYVFFEERKNKEVLTVPVSILCWEIKSLGEKGESRWDKQLFHWSIAARNSVLR